MDSDNDQDQHWMININGEKVPVRNTYVVADQEGAVPVRIMTNEEQNTALNQQKHSKQLQHVILNTNNGTFNNRINYTARSQQQNNKQQMKQSTNTSPDKKSAKRPRVVEKDKINTNANSALSPLSNNKFAILDLDVLTTPTNTNVHAS